MLSVASRQGNAHGSHSEPPRDTHQSRYNQKGQAITSAGEEARELEPPRVAGGNAEGAGAAEKPGSTSESKQGHPTTQQSTPRNACTHGLRPHRDADMNVRGSAVGDSQRVNPNTHQLKNKQNVVCPHNGTVFGHKKECSIDSCHNTGGPYSHCK